MVDISSESKEGEKGSETNHSLKVDKDFGEDVLVDETKDQSLKNIEKEPPKIGIFHGQHLFTFLLQVKNYF